MATMQYRRNPLPVTLQKFYAVVTVALLVGMPAPAAAQEGCPQPPAQVEPIRDEPWAQDWFAPERLHQLSQGEGVRVAVLDTGVDAGHPQLDDGQVLAGVDMLREPLGAHVDCVSHGTAVASVVAASRDQDVGFIGLAPEAEILPVRVAEQDSDSAHSDVVDADDLAAGIRWATDHDAQIINISIAFLANHPVLAEAIEYAIDRGVIVVAAVGEPLAPGAGPPYPAAYEGVVGVGAIGYDNTRALVVASAIGPYVDLVAPGVDVTAAVTGSGHAYWDGSSFAAPFVSAAAALVLAAQTDLTGPEVVARLFTTADTGPGGPAVSGYGVVNPYRALTEPTAWGEPAPAQPPADPAVDPAALARAEQWRSSITLAAILVGTALVTGAVVTVGRAAWRRGQLRAWRPTRSPHRPEPDTTADAPERLFFTIPAARDRR
jgi:membrane-anchored mycosin MYCP